MESASDRTGDVLDRFHPAVASWFREQFGEPTPPQRLGWPVIASGRHSLIVAPTGSGKTLAAFLAALDHLWRTPRRDKGVRILYVSPLKALNQDVWRNLQIPLEGIRAASQTMGTPLPPLTVSVRSGDTPSHERARMVRKPPDILITTPESLHLMLTSRARGILGGISHVIVDEIHAVCGNKRGAFLALLLERLETINPASFVRIGLSATQRPLEAVAGYLGGHKRDGGTSFQPRPVAVIDAGWRRDLDLQVIWPASPDRPLVAGMIWPAIEERLTALVRDHRSTIIFTNNRRIVEKLTARLNEAAMTDGEGAAPPESRSAPVGRGSPREEPARQEAHPPEADAAARPFRAHHGSLSLEERRATEEALKRGELSAVVATASLELGIDMGAVDLVCQVESPGNVTRGLQRVGRAGHVVHGISRGRLIAKTAGDLLESAALCRAMLQGQIEHLRVPKGCLDVLAQQVVACVAMEPWDVSALFDMVRGAEPYRELTAGVFESILRLISGRFPTPGLRDLRARVFWDPIHNRLTALPGTGHLALVGGGTIPDTGQFPVYLGEGGPRLGELDEEFVYERRVGETFILGNSAWRIDTIEPHRVVVGKAEGQPGVVPFWRGEGSSRSPKLGEAVGALCRELAGRLDDPELLSWLEGECRLAPAAARYLRQYVARQHRLAGVVPDDRTVLVETFLDPAGELGLAVLTPFGGKLHLALKLALLGRIRQRFGLTPSCLHADAGLLFRLPRVDDPPLDLFEGLTAELAEHLICEELPDTALFGLRFRQNAARALLMPRPDPAKRTPLWLQRLRAKDLLQVTRQFPDFPIVVETFRECLDDDLDLPRLRAFLEAIQEGTIRVVRRQAEIPSPFTSELIFLFTAAHLYQWDEPRRSDRRPAASVVDADLLEPLLHGGPLDDWLDPQAVGRVDHRLRRLGRPPRTPDEMAEHLRLLGDLTPAEISGPMPRLLAELHDAGRALVIELSGTADRLRWIATEEEPLYRTAFPQACATGQGGVAGIEPVGPAVPAEADCASGPLPAGTTGPPVAIPAPIPATPSWSGARLSPRDEAALSTIVQRFLRTHALIGLSDVTARYPISAAEATELLERWFEEGKAVRLDETGAPGEARWVERDNLAEMRRATLAARRHECPAVAPEVFADFLLRWQHVHPLTQGEGPAFVEGVLEQLQGYGLSAVLWETEVLFRRVKDYRPAWLDEVLGRGAWFWRAERAARDELRIAFFPRDSLLAPEGMPETETAELTLEECEVLAQLDRSGASFATDLARASGLEPSRVRCALVELMGRGRVTNDRFDPLRPGSQSTLQALTEAASARRDRHSLRIRPRRSILGQPEGRWSRLSRPAGGDAENRLLAWAGVLLERYGLVTREVVALDQAAPDWGELAPLLARAEWRGELRRGYFVEGLSGVQYATADAAQELARLAIPPETSPPLVLLSTMDPANLYGAGAPLDVELLDGGAARLPRLPGNFLVLRQGRPILIIESYGRRLTALPWAPQTDIDSALKFLPSLTGPSRRILKVEMYNGLFAVESPAVAGLTRLGFVRDYPGMTYYAGLSATPVESP
jgi:ATP-dependent Lhr-like helicase